jgi:hypothetical protein
MLAGVLELGAWRNVVMRAFCDGRNERADFIGFFVDRLRYRFVAPAMLA